MTTAPHDPRDYVTRGGHELKVGDVVDVLVPQRAIDALDCEVVALLPRHHGDVADVQVRDRERRRLIVNAVNVELAAEPEYDERTCSLCDAVGHGYPGAGPCPLEDAGEPDEGYVR